mgnify:CR=1 FL=1
MKVKKLSDTNLSLHFREVSRRVDCEYPLVSNK